MAETELNQNRSPEVRVVGNEQTPVIVIDDPITSTASLQEAANQDGGFHMDRRAAYPGVRTELPKDYVDTIVPPLVKLLRETYGIPDSLDYTVVQKVFSLVTTPPEDLAILQRVPHFDDLKPWYFATVHYLNPGEYAGTGIFRHRPTGFERISAERSRDYVRAAEAHMKANGLPEARYITESTDHYELIETIDYRPNRLVSYPGNLLHSGLVQPGRDIDWRPASGRLTANLFIDFLDAL